MLHIDNLNSEGTSADAKRNPKVVRGDVYRCEMRSGGEINVSGRLELEFQGG
jgi:hypothetical protein